jgi:hypothetical protein
MNAVQNAPTPTAQEWTNWIDNLPRGVWEWSRFKGKDINLNKELFPPFILNPDDPKRTVPASVNQYLNRAKGLSTWEREHLFSLGNPTIPENEGGLRYEDICRHIQSSGRNIDGPGSKGYLKKGAPPMFFQTRDQGNNYGSIFRRIYWYINQPK